MPYRDPERQRLAKNEAARRRRARRRTAGVEPVEPALGPLIPPTIRLRSVDDALTLLEGQTASVLTANARPLERARCIGYLLGIGLRAIEASILEQRISTIEERLNADKNHKY